MKNGIILLFLFLTLMFLQAQIPDRTVNFIPSLQGVPNASSITAALAATAAPGTIWVAAGTYQEAELIIPLGITVIGGFPANATALSDRIFPGNATKVQQTVLDGNHAHRVAKVLGVLDGCVLTKGYAYDSTGTTPLNAAGGGVLIDGGIVQNSIIIDNAAAEKSPTPGTIPGTFIASIGDIYCTDGTILEPTYALNSSGKMVATLPGGIPAGKTPQGIVFYVDPSATTSSFYVMGKVSSNAIQPWTNPTFDVPGVPSLSNKTQALADFNGRANTDSIIAYIPRWIIANGTQWWQPTVNYDAVKYAYEYNVPAGTQGQWYLPAGGEVNKIWEVYPQMDACARDILGWINAGQTMFPKSYYWSSSEVSAGEIWILTTNAYPWGTWGLQKTPKTTNGYVVPVVAIKISQ